MRACGRAGTRVRTRNTHTYARACVHTHSERIITATNPALWHATRAIALSNFCHGAAASVFDWVEPHSSLGIDSLAVLACCYWKRNTLETRVYAVSRGIPFGGKQHVSQRSALPRSDRGSPRQTFKCLRCGILETFISYHTIIILVYSSVIIILSLC